MHEYACAEDGLVIYDCLSCQLGTIAYDALVAHDGIMSHMYTFHEQIVAAHHSLSLSCRTTVDGHILTYLIVVAHFSCSILSSELEILRNGTDDGSGEDDVSISYACSIEYGHTVHQRIVVTYDHALVYVAEGTYLAIFAYHSLWMYIGQGTDLAHNSIIYKKCMK